MKTAKPVFAWAVCIVAFHNRNVWSDADLAARLSKLKHIGDVEGEVRDGMLEQLGGVGKRYLREIKATGHAKA